jgi:hypothetical protein
MRACMVGLFLTAAVLLPKTGTAQPLAFRTPPPQVTAATADWQINGEAIVVNGLVYHPTRVYRLFDGQVMRPVGTFDRAPVYADVTLEPFSAIYVPVGGGRMREYERRRDGDLAGTTGSRTPSFPVAVATELVPREPEAGTSMATGAVGTTGVRTDTGVTEAVGTTGVRADTSATRVAGTAGTAIDSSAVGTSGRSASSVPTVVGAISAPDRTRPRRTSIESIPRPSATNGVWLEFDGARWYADGPAATFSPDRFEPIGEYRGFPVYRDKTSKKGEIWVSVVKDGPVAPYTKR